MSFFPSPQSALAGRLYMDSYIFIDCWFVRALTYTNNVVMSEYSFRISGTALRGPDDDSVMIFGFEETHFHAGQWCKQCGWHGRFIGLSIYYDIFLERIVVNVILII